MLLADCFMIVHIMLAVYVIRIVVTKHKENNWYGRLEIFVFQRRTTDNC